MENTALQAHEPHPRTNLLLAALPDDIWQRWSTHLQPVDLRRGEVMGRPDIPSAWAVFPVSAIVSLMCTTHEGGTAEICVVGPEGVVGLPLVRGCADTSGQPVVQTAGRAYRIKSHLVADEIQNRGEVLNILLRYSQVVLAQVAQTALCNRHHSIDQQVCRRLLLSLDRTASNEVAMTQASIAHGLGVRREGVSESALKLQQAGVIRYSRGRIFVLDRPELERRACGCYWTARREQDRLFPAAAASSLQSSAVSSTRGGRLAVRAVRPSGYFAQSAP